MAGSHIKAKMKKTLASSSSKTTRSTSQRASRTKTTGRLKKSKFPSYNRGDLVTGKDRSYKRSIYKYIGPSVDPLYGEFEFVTLGENTAEQYMRGHRFTDKSAITFRRLFAEFRKATPKEIKKSNQTRARYLLRFLLFRLGILAFV